MKNLLSKLNLFEVILLGVVARSFIVGPTGSDAAIVIALVAATVYVKDYLTRHKLNDYEELRKEITNMKEHVTAIKLDKGIKPMAMLRSPTSMTGQTDEKVRRF